MAINYTKVGWNTTKYVNPTNMNQMDDGIKAACDGVDELKGSQITSSNGYVVAPSTASATIPSGTDTTILSLTLPTAGLWTVYGYLILPETSSTVGNGYRAAWIWTDETTLPSDRYQRASVGSNTSLNGIKLNTPFLITKPTTVYLRVRQTSGVNMSSGLKGLSAVKEMNI